MTRSLLLTAALALAAALPLSAQDPRPLGEVLDGLADLWEGGDAHGIAELAASSGVDFEVHGLGLGSVSGRKLAGALRRVFEDRVTVSVVSNMTSPVMGVEDRAFGELTWEVRLGGATVTERSTVFLALVREPAGWRVTQIRILE